jgi:signal peptidase I
MSLALRIPIVIASVLYICTVLPLTVFSTSYLVKTYRVPSGSMEPALRCGDRFMVERLTHRSTHPKRTDVVAFHPPAGTDEDGNPKPSSVRSRFGSGEIDVSPSNITYIKRVIGLPGDTVEVHEHKAIVNGNELDEPYRHPLPDDLSVNSESEFGPYTVPEKTYFVLGDNRDNSSDSRVFGVVPQSFIVGRVGWIYWPPSHFGEPSRDAGRGFDEGPDTNCLEG